MYCNPYRKVRVVFSAGKTAKKAGKNLKKGLTIWLLSCIINKLFQQRRKEKFAAIAQSVERILGKDEVPGSNPGSSSKKRSEVSTSEFFVAVTNRGPHPPARRADSINQDGAESKIRSREVPGSNPGSSS